MDTYLSPWRTRDVIETPLIGLLDVNGWDLAKALRLLAQGNTVLIELESRTGEMGSGTVPIPIAEFIADEFDRATDAFPKTDQDLDRARDITAAFFRKEVLAAGDGL